MQMISVITLKNNAIYFIICKPPHYDVKIFLKF